MNGVIANGIGIIIGTVLGILLKRWIKEDWNQLMMKTLGFCVMAIGLKDAIGMNNPIILLVSMLLGGMIGNLLQLEQRLNNFGLKVERRFQKEGSSNTIAQGFILATIIYCVGAMSIMASIKAGVSGDHNLLYVKTVLDGVSAMLFAATMGFGVGLSFIPVVIYQGLIFLFAGYLQPIMTPDIITELSAVGGIIIVMISFNILEIKKMPIADFLPAIIIPVIIGYFLG